MATIGSSGLLPNGIPGHGGVLVLLVPYPGNFFALPSGLQNPLIVCQKLNRYNVEAADTGMAKEELNSTECFNYLW